jgi:hypothetical protein
MATTPRHRSQPDDHDAGAAVWGFIWVLFAFKLVTVGLIFYHLRTFESGLVIGSTLWYWFPALGVLAGGPLLFRYRLRRVRARRDALRRAEWMVDQERDVPRAVSHEPRVTGHEF